MTTETKPNEPAFPIRFILEDGEVVEVAHPDDIFDHFQNFDSTDPAQKAWVRDVQDRSVRLRMSGGEVHELVVDEELAR